MKIRINKFIAQNLQISRRKADEVISFGKILVNGEKAEVGQAIDEDKDEVTYQGKIITASDRPQNVYYAVYKPLGYVSTNADKFAAKKVVDLVPKNPKVFPVGRLDKNSEGLMLLTNDGDITQKLTHPSFKHIKKYVVTVKKIKNKKIDMQNLSQRLDRGVKLREGIARFDEINIFDEKNNIENGKLRMIVTLHQGWKRQIRRMFDVLGYEVVKLKRITFGKLDLRKLNIKIGKYKKINQIEIL